MLPNLSAKERAILTRAARVWLTSHPTAELPSSEGDSAKVARNNAANTRNWSAVDALESVAGGSLVDG